MSLIGKTRQKPVGKIEEVFDPQVGKARGVLRRPPSAGKFRHFRWSPSPDLGHWIAHYWMVSWDLRGRAPHLQETVPHPNFHVVFEKDNSTVSGVYTDKFVRRLEGQSHVFGIKFPPRRLPSVFERSRVGTRQSHHPRAAHLGEGCWCTVSHSGIVLQRGQEGGSFQCLLPCACAGA